MGTAVQHNTPDSPTGTPLDATERANEHLRTLDRMIRLTGLADTKAAPLLAAQATVAAVTATQVHKAVVLVRDGNAVELIAAALFALAYLACSASSIVLTLRVLLPKDAPGAGSLLYFADIASMEFRDFAERSTTLSAEGLEQDALAQTHVVASIVASKFRRVRQALLALMGALAGWVGLMALVNY